LDLEYPVVKTDFVVDHRPSAVFKVTGRDHGSFVAPTGGHPRISEGEKWKREWSKPATRFGKESRFLVKKDAAGAMRRERGIEVIKERHGTIERWVRDSQQRVASLQSTSSRSSLQANLLHLTKQPQAFSHSRSLSPSPNNGGGPVVGVNNDHDPPRDEGGFSGTATLPTSTQIPMRSAFLSKAPKTDPRLGLSPPPEPPLASSSSSSSTTTNQQAVAVIHSTEPDGSPSRKLTTRQSQWAKSAPRFSSSSALTTSPSPSPSASASASAFSPAFPDLQAKRVLRLGTADPLQAARPHYNIEPRAAGEKDRPTTVCDAHGRYHKQQKQRPTSVFSSTTSRFKESHGGEDLLPYRTGNEANANETNANANAASPKQDSNHSVQHSRQHSPFMSRASRFGVSTGLRQSLDINSYERAWWDSNDASEVYERKTILPNGRMLSRKEQKQLEALAREVPHQVAAVEHDLLQSERYLAWLQSQGTESPLKSP
jgi:hypothetical protein